MEFIGSSLKKKDIYPSACVASFLVLLYHPGCGVSPAWIGFTISVIVFTFPFLTYITHPSSLIIHRSIHQPFHHPYSLPSH